ncbi:hypothetical protein AB0M36_30530 [Actinoplanes sp. NPDC051346]|uniref:hypothetical protein n=1 Tax=Actinoplanes sp. NPDC051346 TaxID=3155048 RepID=UPI003422A1B5
MTAGPGAFTPVLIPSVYLGPAAWQPVAGVLRDRFGLSAVTLAPPWVGSRPGGISLLR